MHYPGFLLEIIKLFKSSNINMEYLQTLFDPDPEIEPTHLKG